MVNTSHDINLT